MIFEYIFMLLWIQRSTEHTNINVTKKEIARVLEYNEWDLYMPVLLSEQSRVAQLVARQACQACHPRYLSSNPAWGKLVCTK